ncbi:MAG: TMEM165/GDT1 family protein [Cyanothece sp. SIO1E1]|nr:TMEM165/GDT1 family protein [Cyanothece sp. SIO1E1]
MNLEKPADLTSQTPIKPVTDSIQLTASDSEPPQTAEQALDSTSSVQPTESEGLGIFFSTFLTIFLAELGDKTQVTTLLMSAESHSPWVVFAGAGSALVLTSLLGVLLGQWLATRIAPKVLETAAGMTLLLIATLLFWDILHV